MSIQALKEYTFTSKYAQYLPKKQRRETWIESNSRVEQMHLNRYPQIEKDIKWAFDRAKKKIALGSQRALQFGGVEIENKHAKIYNCFDESQEFITSKGVKSFRDFKDGDIVEVLSHNGSWQNAVVRNYGEDFVNTIYFKNSDNYFESKATANHRWLLKDGEITDQLEVGDRILKQEPIFQDFDYEEASPMEKLYWAYGFVYGDGVVNNGYSMVRLCGKDQEYEYRFTSLGFKSSSSTSLKGDIICYTGKYQKQAPDPEKDSKELIKAFVAGYLDADGTKNSNKTGSPYNYIQSSEVDHIEFIRKCFPVAGVFIISETDLTGQETNYGIRPYTIKFRIKSKDGITSQYTKVIGIEKGKTKVPVWCLEVQNTKSFVFPNGTPTGNCIASYCDRPRFFGECMWLLLCGCGTGFSVQKHHVEKLPEFVWSNGKTKIFKAEDSIEGWADCINALIASYMGGIESFEEYEGYDIKFDLSAIRQEGAPVGPNKRKAPGPEPLRKSLEKIREILKNAVRSGQSRLSPIQCYDIIMHSSDAVLSGGIRRSATICLFSPDDLEMAQSKTGNWFIDNPQRGRSNNSAVLLRDSTTSEQFKELMQYVKEYGEPGFIWVDDLELLVNPCVEIGLYAYDENGNSGWQACNLCEINGKYCATKEKFLEACAAAAIIGTCQAGYTDLTYLGPVTKRILEKEALLGVSMTGMMDNPEVLFDPKTQREGARLILEQNARIAKAIGINPAARATCIKPAGTTSCVLGTSSGIHPHHAKRYIRRTQGNYLEEPIQFFQKINPLAVEKSVWSANGTDNVISFCVEVPDGSKTKNDINAIGLLELVKLTQQNWVEHGKVKERCTTSWLSHNVSNTISVKDNEWEEVTKYIYKNRKWFAGISLLPISGDKDYAQAPFTAIYTPTEMVREYGDAAVFASGVIVDALHAFDNNLWAACEFVLGIRKLDPNEPLRHDWVRRAKQFAERYFDGDIKKMTYCLKDVNNWKYWCDLNREYKKVDYSLMIEDKDNTKLEETIACAGGSCEI